MNRDLDYVMFTSEQLSARVKEIGQQLTEEYAGKAPILLCIMTVSYTHLTLPTKRIV